MAQISLVSGRFTRRLATPRYVEGAGVVNGTSVSNSRRPMPGGPNVFLATENHRATRNPAGVAAFLEAVLNGLRVCPLRTAVATRT
jgi:hypothetical protein